MKKTVRIIRNLIIVIYAIIAIAVTICLLSYNDYKISEIGTYSLVIIDNNELSPEFNKGNLVIVNKAEKPKIGDRVFFYNTYEKEISVSIAEIVAEEQITDSEITYTLEGEQAISSEYILGISSSSTKIAGLGTVLGILESKWGFLFLVILPCLLAFIYEIWEVVSQVRSDSKKTGNEKNA